MLHSTSDDQPSNQMPPPQQIKLDFFKNTFLTWPKYTPFRNLSRISTVLHATFRTGLIFLIWSKWVQGVVCYDWNLQNCKYLSGISIILHETFRTGLIFPSRSKWVQGVVCYDQNLQNHKYLSRISIVLHPNLQSRAHFSELVGNESKEWYATIETYKNVNIPAEYQTVLHETFRTGLIFPSRSKWV